MKELSLLELLTLTRRNHTLTDGFYAGIYCKYACSCGWWSTDMNRDHYDHHLSYALVCSVKDWMDAQLNGPQGMSRFT